MRHPTTEFSRKRTCGMPKFVNPEQKSNGIGSSGGTLLAIIPIFVIFYVLLVLPFLSDEDRTGRVENILFWPIAALLTLTLVFWHRAGIDRKFFLSLPIISLFVYIIFAAASVTWAYSPDYAFNRLGVQVLVVMVIVLPYAVPTGRKYTIPGVHLCYAIALAISAVFVLTTKASPIGHPGYFYHKQELGFLASAGLILSSHEFLQGGWRRLVAAIAMGLGIWLLFESGSKTALAFALVASVCSWLILQLCKKTRLTPAHFVAAVVLASLFVSTPIERIGYRLYGDATLTGRTEIWSFINYRISQKAWFGWGFRSYYGVPNSPHNAAPGFVRDMPSSHSGYLELKLETGRIGYWIFLVFIYSSLHLLERVRRIDPVRAWCYLSIALFATIINLTDSVWFVLDSLWVLYLFVVAEAVRFCMIEQRAGSNGPGRWLRGRPATVAKGQTRQVTPSIVAGCSIGGTWRTSRTS
jgi:exopolysaccharide production protein ExoQ